VEEFNCVSSSFVPIAAIYIPGGNALCYLAFIPCSFDTPPLTSGFRLLTDIPARSRLLILPPGFPPVPTHLEHMLGYRRLFLTALIDHSEYHLFYSPGVCPNASFLNLGLEKAQEYLQFFFSLP